MDDKKEDKAIYDRLDGKMKGLLGKHNIDNLTGIQRYSFEKIDSGSNVLLISPTGSGKTLAAFIPIYNRWLREKPIPISILYISPMKSLNRDMIEHLERWANELEMEIAVRHGDTSAYERKQQQEFPNDMLILTLEMLQSTLTGKKIREHLRNVKYIVIDEVHEIVNSKRGVQLAVALERLRELCGDFQLVMLSATVADPEKVANFFAGGKRVDIVESGEEKKMEISVVYPKSVVGDKKIAESALVSIDAAARLRTIMEMIKDSKSTLLFTNTRDFAEILTSRIKNIDRWFSAEIHHSSLSKDVRIKAEQEFKDRKIKSLICTSSLQLGIDIGSVDLVLQYMSPRRVVQALQRIGRSGHSLTETSRGIIIATDDDDIFESTAIAAKALRRELERTYNHESPYDVLAHQIIGLTFDFWDLGLDKAFQLIKRAYPFRNLNYSEFLETCKQLEKLGLVFLNDTIRKRTRGFQYYFEQLSTIPTIKQFRIYNTFDNSFVGVLDEEFIALHGEPNTTFIVKGQPWRILSIEQDRVLVEPSSDNKASVPGWEGELIPVSFEVAQEVGKIRRRVSELLGDGTKADEKLCSEYPIDRNCARMMSDLIKRQKKSWIVPDDENMLIEDYENLVIIHTCFGTTVNETIGRFVTALLSSRIGTIGLKVDPYRIMLQTQEKAAELVREVLMKTDPEHLKSYIEMSLGKSELFAWKFVHVAKRFGAISRDADFGKMTMKKIIEEYDGSPIQKETLKELEVEKLDVERSTDLLKKMQSSGISVHVQHGLSPIGHLGIKDKYAELVSGGKPDKEIFEIFKNRVLNTKVRLVCMNCGDWEQMFVVKNISDDVRCGKCGSILLAETKNMTLNNLRLVKNGRKDNIKDAAERKRYKVMRKKADVFMTYRRNAAIVMAGRGVGPISALRILSKYHRDDNELFRDILDAERMFVKNKRYWTTG